VVGCCDCCDWLLCETLYNNIDVDVDVDNLPSPPASVSMGIQTTDAEV